MPRTRAPYTPEFRRQMVELVRAGRDPDELAREFEPTAQSIRTWVAQADRQEGQREGAVPGLAVTERDELVRLRRENRQLRVERDILSKAATGTHRTRAMGPGPGSHGRLARSRQALRVHERERRTKRFAGPGLLPGCRHGPCAPRVQG